MPPVREIALALASLAVLGRAPHAAAQAPADTYKIGERVEVRPTPPREIWEPGVVTDFTYDTGQLIVRWAANERAFEDRDVRHLAPPPPRSPEKAAGGAGDRKAALARMVEASPPDDGPVPATPRR